MVSPGMSSFTVSNEELDVIATKLKTHADELGTVNAPLSNLPTATADELGEKAHEAYRLFFEAWQREADVITEAMRETGTKLDETVKHYCEIDAIHAGVFGGILGSGGGNSSPVWPGVPFK